MLHPQHVFSAEVELHSVHDCMDGSHTAWSHKVVLNSLFSVLVMIISNSKPSVSYL